MKKNFNKIPKFIKTIISKIASDDVVVSCTKKIELKDDVWKKYTSLGISPDDAIGTINSFIPSAIVGKFSNNNLVGLEKIRKDLPKVRKSFSQDVPNWGDWSKGSHDITRIMNIYQREFIPPKGVSIRWEILEKNAEWVAIKFSTDEILNKKNANFDSDLLFNLNLLQENIGSVSVFASTATREEYLKSAIINWEILPPGTRDSVVSKIIARIKNPNAKIIDTINDRYTFISQFNPIAFIIGTSGFDRYFGAKIKENFVIFENLEYGNAIYVMFDGWEELSKLDRTTLLQNQNKRKFLRVIHSKKWKKNLKEIICLQSK